MRTLARLALTGSRCFLSALAFCAIALLLLADTTPGLSVLSWTIARLSGGTVSIVGLSGTLPDFPHADAVELRDARGVWLRAENVSLDWQASAAFRNRFEIGRISAARIVLSRLPERQKSEGKNPQIDIRDLSIDRIEIAGTAPGNSAVLSARGSLHYLSIHQLVADLIAIQLNGAGRYRAQGRIDRDVATGAVAITENANGVLGTLIGLPHLGAIDLRLTMGGDATANTIALDLTAGALRATGRGTIALARRHADLDFSVKAPAMQPNATVSWQSLALDGHVHGDFDTLFINAKLKVENATTNGAQIALLSADIAGSNGIADLSGSVTGLHIPGDRPDLFSAAPVALKAHADFKAATRPVAFSLSHPLATIIGSVQTAGIPTLAGVIDVPSLAPFAALRNVDMPGSAQLMVHIRQEQSLTTLALDGTLKADGTGPIARLLGHAAKLSLRADISGDDISNSTLMLRGAALSASANGNYRDRNLNYAIALGLPDVSQLAAPLNGNVTLTGRIAGPLKSASFRATGDATLASKGFAPQRIGISLQAENISDPTSASIRASGQFDKAPVSIAGELSAKTHNAHLTAAWKSLNAVAQLTVDGREVGSGQLSLDVKRLSDMAAFVDTPIDGALSAAIDFKLAGPVTRASIRARASGVRVGDAKLATVNAVGTIDDPLAKPVLALAVDVRGVDAAGLSGDGAAHLNGPPGELAIVLKSELRDGAGSPAQISASALLNAQRKSATIQELAANWRAGHLRLVTPATLNFANGIAVDRVNATFAGGNIQLSGQLTPKLAVQLSAENISAGMLQSFVPQMPDEGTISATAQLSGTLANPRGPVELQAHGLSMHAISGSAIAPGNLIAHAVLNNGTVALNATLTTGHLARLSVTGNAPLTRDKPVALHVSGSADLVLLNPVLAVDGRQVRGTVTMDGNVAGTFAAPRITGDGKLADAELQDFARGMGIRNISADIHAQGSRIAFAQLTGHAGNGTIAGSGTIDLGVAGLPVDVSLTLKNARPIVSDRLTATLSGDAKIEGKLDELVTISGRFQVEKGEINLPERFPPQVAVLDVRRPGQAALPGPQAPSRIVLDITVSAPNQFFIRGHGIDADIGGRIHLTGNADSLRVGGGFDMNRGTLTVAGQVLTFTSGRIGFDGAGLRNRLDPTLDFVAQTNSGGVTATLTVSGFASAPKIVLSSSPQLPQDEILARLLFQQSVKQLSPLQLAQIAQALASMGGIGSHFDAVELLRKGLGLDRISVGGGSDGTQTTIEAGKYVARNVYIGVRQNLSGGTQAQVQYDITHNLKAQATLSTGTTPAVTNGNAAQDTGSSVGLSYQFEY